MISGLDSVSIYQAWGDKSMTILLAESNSYNTLAKILNLSVSTIFGHTHLDESRTRIKTYHKY
jgi:DNA-binding CsgD family transcriptional regulator